MTAWIKLVSVIANIVAILNSNYLNIELPGVKSLKFFSDKNEGLAKTKRSVGELVINLYYWNKLKPEHKFFVVAHECGHICCDTKDELVADKFASDLYLKTGLSLTESVKALSNYLNVDNPVHIARAWAQYQRALRHDWEKNGNIKTYRRKYDSVSDVKQKLFFYGSV